MKTKRVLTSFALPHGKGTPLPEIGAFGKDDFMRARYYSALIERYATKAETEVLVKFARERIMPGMSFADTLEATARHIHFGNENALASMLDMTKRDKEVLEKEFTLKEVTLEAVAAHGPESPKVASAMAQALLKMYPGATRERIIGALTSGNTSDGFSHAAVIEAMQLTEPVDGNS